MSTLGAWHFLAREDAHRAGQLTRRGGGRYADWLVLSNSETKPTTTRAEHVLSAVIGQPTLLYPSGIAAFWAILLHVRPDVIAITGGYGGCHAAIDIYRRTRGEDQVVRHTTLNPLFRA